MPIIGNGDIASVLVDDEDHYFFVSGVSNSGEDYHSKAFFREYNALKNQRKDKHLVYFSTLSIMYTRSPYIEHKIIMEELIQRWFPLYTIIRIGNITWGKNPNTFINYYKAHPDMEILDDFRHIITKDALRWWVWTLKNTVGTFNVTGETLKVQEIVDRIKDGRL